MEEKKPRSGAVRIVRQVLDNDPKTNYEIAQIANLTPSQVSMSLSYLTKVNYCEREQIDRQTTYGRKRIYAYKLTNASQAS